MNIKKIIAVSLCAALVSSTAAITVSATEEELSDRETYLNNHSFGIVGSFTTWGGDDDIQMTDPDGDGVYTAEVTIDPGKYEFRVRADSAWDDSWAAYEENYDRTYNSQHNLVTEVNERTTFTVLFDTTGDDYNLWTVSTEGLPDITPEPEPEPEPEELIISNHSVGITGSFTQWGAEPDIRMYDPDGDGIYTGEFEVDDEGEYEFKVRLDDEWIYSWGDNDNQTGYTLNSSQPMSFTVSQPSNVTVELDTNGSPEYWYITISTSDKENDDDKPSLDLSDHSVGIVGSFNNWRGPDVTMNDDDGDGVWSGVVDIPTVTEPMLNGNTVTFRVRLDEDWDYSWGIYESDYVRTFNSQTNCFVEAEKGMHLKIYVTLDTTRNSPQAIESGAIDADEPEDYNLWVVDYDYEVVDNDDMFAYEEKDDGIWITGFDESVSELEIPDEIDGVPVVGIDEYAFCSSSGLKKVVICDTIKEIAEGAFYGCSDLEEVVFEGTVGNIGEYAFADCESLTSIAIPEGIRTLSSYVLAYDTSLTKVELPDTLEEIEYGAFAYTSNLEEINVSARNSILSSYDGALYDDDLTTLIMCPNGKKSIEIPDTVTAISDSAFANCSDITEIELPDSLTTIGRSAFIRSGLKSINIPASVESMGFGLFAYCNDMETITVDGDNAVYSSFKGMLLNKEQTKLIYCPQAKSEVIDIPDTVKEIGQAAFADCSKIKIVVIPVGVETISSGAFQGATELMAVSIPDTVVDIAETALLGNEKLTIVGYERSAAQAYAETNNINFYKIPQLVNTSTVESEVVEPGTKVVINGSAEGGCDGYTYAFYYKRTVNTKWNKIGTEFGDATTASFKPVDEAEFDVKVIVMDSYGKKAEKIIKVTAAEKSLANNSFLSASRVPAGTKVTISGKAENGTAPYTYAFYYKRTVNTKWKKIGTEFGTADTATLTPLDPAEYEIKVIVKDAKGKTAEKVMKLTSTESNALVNNSTVNTLEASVGDDIRLMGIAAGGEGQYKYAYYFKRSVNSKWNKIGKEFDSSLRATLVPTAAADYDLKVIVKDKTGATAEKTFKVSVAEKMALKNTSVINKDTIVKAGTTITFSGMVVGGTKPVTYQFMFKRSANSKWNSISYGNREGTFAKFTPTAASEYDLKCIAVDANGTKAEKIIRITAVE